MVHRYAGKKCYKQRVSYHIEGLSKGLDFGVFNSDINSLEKAVKERVLYVSDGKGGFCTPPQPEENSFFELWQAYKERLTSDKFVSPLTEDQFLGAYDGRKRTIYKNALDSLKIKPLTPRDSRVKYFMKVEKVNFTAKPNSVPRGISPRDPRFHVSLGVYIKRIEKSVYKSIDRAWGYPTVKGYLPTVMKGYNAGKRGRIIAAKWKEFTDPVAVGIDASRFDQHVSVEALSFEHKTYLTYFAARHRDTLEALLEKQLFNRGVGHTQDGKLKFKVDGVRMSGDMNTSLGNVLLMCMVTLALRDTTKVNFSFVNDGDDGVLMMERKDLKKIEPYIKSHYLKYGFNVVLEEPVFELEHIEFCQCKPVMVDETTCVMVRNVDVSFDKDTMSVLPINKTSAPKWARSVGLCGLSLAADVPVLCEFYRTLSKQSKRTITLHSEGWLMMADGMNAKQYVTPYARFSYWKAFGVPPDKQVEQENYYKQVKLDLSLSNKRNHNPTLWILT